MVNNALITSLSVGSSVVASELAENPYPLVISAVIALISEFVKYLAYKRKQRELKKKV